MNQEPLAREFRQERAIRRATFMLEAKRRRIRSDLKQLIRHLDLLMPNPKTNSAAAKEQSILKAALGRLDDEAFAQLLQEILAEQKTP